MSAQLPNFFIVGAPKAATTFLYESLQQHPQVYMSPLKEPNYFASEMRPEYFPEEARARVARQMREIKAYLRGDMREKRFGGFVTSWEDYLKLFRAASSEVAIGEASPSYLWSRTAAQNIASHLPHARIIINLRNPIERAFSHYLHQVTEGLTNLTFRQTIEASLRALHGPFAVERTLLEFGHYCGQIERYQKEFPREQIHISLYDDLEHSPVALMENLLTFLGVDPDIRLDASRRHLEPRIPKLNGMAYFLKRARLWPHLRKLLPQPLGPRLRSALLRSRRSLVMDPADRAFLKEYYHGEIESLAALLGRDLSSWLDHRAPAPPRDSSV